VLLRLLLTGADRDAHQELQARELRIWGPGHATSVYPRLAGKRTAQRKLARSLRALHISLNETRLMKHQGTTKAAIVAAHLTARGAARMRRLTVRVTAARGLHPCIHYA
jgi:hypothetical protein